MVTASGRMPCWSCYIIILVSIIGLVTYGQPSYGVQQMCGFVDYALATPSFNQSITKTQKLCFNLCLDHPNCSSANYFLERRLCALKNASHLDNNQQLIVTPGSFYAHTEAPVDCTIPTSTKETNVDFSSTLSKRSCQELLEAGYDVSGTYTIFPAGARTAAGLRVYCDMETDAGGWIVFQKRQDGSVDFWRNWAEYQSGFGNLSGEFWLGNDNLVTLTSDDSRGAWELRVDLEDWANNTAWAKYSDFQISPGEYNLTIGQYDDISTAGDSLGAHRGHPFSTDDRDNDAAIGNCATLLTGAWWFVRCARSHLNGRYYYPYENANSRDGIKWKEWKLYKYSVKACTMKMRESTP